MQGVGLFQQVHDLFWSGGGRQRNPNNRPSLRQLQQPVIKLGNRIGGIGAVKLLCAFHPGPRSVPDLSLAVLWLYEQREFPLGVFGGEYRRGMRFPESGEKKEVGILTKDVFDIGVTETGNGGHYHRQTLGADQIGKSLPVMGERVIHLKSFGSTR